MSHSLSVPGPDGVSIQLNTLADTAGLPLRTLVELVGVGPREPPGSTGRTSAGLYATTCAVFGPELLTTLAGYAQDAVCVEVAKAALLQTAHQAVSADLLAPEAAALGISDPAQLARLGERMTLWRTQGASQVYRSLSEAVARMSGHAAPATAAVEGSNVIVVGPHDEGQAAQCYPRRRIVRYGDIEAGRTWHSALLLTQPDSSEAIEWLVDVARRCLGGLSCGVWLRGSSNPVEGQDPAHMVIAWDAADLDAITAELGAAPWITLWGGTPTGSMLTDVVTYGWPQTRRQAEWFSTAIEPRIMAPVRVRPRPPVTA